MADHSPAYSEVAEQFDDALQQRDAATLGMWAFLATEVLFFGVLFMGYLAYRLAYPDAFAEASHHTHVIIGGINTAILLTSGLTMALSVYSARTGQHRALVVLMLVTMALGAVFIALKGVEYYKEYQEHLVPALNFTFAGPHPDQAEMFYYFYFVMTGLHAIHLTLGIAVIGAITFLARRGHFSSRYPTPVELTGLYWGFVDIVWIFLFPLIYLIGGR